MTIKQCRDISADIANIHHDLPNAEVFTGVLTDTYRYKRIHRNNSNVREVGCWWITVDDGENKRQITIDSEDKFLDSLNKGDIVTIYRPTPATKSYKIYGKDSQETVKNNDWAPGIVLHNEEGQRSSLDPIYKPTPTNVGGSLTTTLISSIIIMVALLYFTDGRPFNSLESIFGAGAAIWVVLAALSIRKGNKRFAQEKQQYETITRYLQHMLECNILDLQAARIKRVYQQDDAVCSDCNNRIPLLSPYCFKCGCQNVAIASLLAPVEENMAFGGIADADATMLEHSQTAVACASADAAVVQKTPVSAHDRLKEKVAAVMYSESTDYIHKYAVGSTKGALHGQVIFGTVIDRDLKSNVRSWTEEQVKTTTYRNGYGREYSESSVVSRVNHRRSNLNGYLVIRTLDGEEHAYNPGSTKLGATDIGDHVMVGLSDAKFDDKTAYNYQQYYFNLSKDDLWTNECITSLSKSGATRTLNGLLFFAAVGTGLYFSETRQEEMMFIPVIMLGTMFVLMFKAVKAKSENKKQRQALAGTLRDKLNIARRERENWLSWLG
ncbi:hypothetical protein [Enterovibrio nigricans]|uniref:Uncharacterized protein n=1 Tax=Enterovibrio nigricans DSM 22720 TaxID=1121868 RepID=A0A1T4U1Z9_9GAMM|nr:hypothetical protein [Enterovibrio nigricans]PKF51171.1 hypothetical protein AT251_06190 [Enterovibrio nigricans]SKA46714.1 hypothetical protein SAMN02745132_00600 [Enterovibrio nigricans DSM 22720]